MGIRKLLFGSHEDISLAIEILQKNHPQTKIVTFLNNLFTHYETGNHAIIWYNNIVCYKLTDFGVKLL